MDCSLRHRPQLAPENRLQVGLGNAGIQLQALLDVVGMEVSLLHRPIVAIHGKIAA